MDDVKSGCSRYSTMDMIAATLLFSVKLDTVVIFGLRTQLTYQIVFVGFLLVVLNKWR